jgi:hypothetical protein
MLLVSCLRNKGGRWKVGRAEGWKVGTDDGPWTMDRCRRKMQDRGCKIEGGTDGGPETGDGRGGWGRGMEPVLKGFGGHDGAANRPQEYLDKTTIDFFQKTIRVLRSA